MIKLFFAPLTRSVRVLWLLEELGLPYELEQVEFLPPSKEFFTQKTPTGKLPTVVDGDVVLCESGAIVEYILEKYGDGRLAPPMGSSERARFLQWIHFAESTAFPPIGIVVWLNRYREGAEGREGAESESGLLADARARAASGLDFLERELGENRYLLGDEFSAADIMMGFTLAAALAVGVLGGDHPRVAAYMGRLQERPAFQRAAATR